MLALHPWWHALLVQVENLNSTTKKIRFAFEDNDLEVQACARVLHAIYKVYSVPWLRKNH